MKQFQIDFSRLHSMTKALQDAHLMVAKDAIDKDIAVIVDYGSDKMEQVESKEQLEKIFASLPSEALSV